MADTRLRHIRNYLIDVRLQLRHVAVVGLLAGVLSAFLGWMIWLQRNQASQAIARSMESAGFMTASQKQDVLDHLQGSDLELVLRMAGVCAGAILLISMFVVLLTHKIAGPLHRVAVAIDALRDGELPSMHAPRRGDELKRFFTSFKGMGDTLRERAQDDLRAYQAFTTAVAGSGVHLAADPELANALAGVQKIEVELEKALGPGGMTRESVN